MTNQEILDRMTEILVDQLGIDEDEVTMDANFIEDLNADSLDIVELVMNLEQEFDLMIPDEEAENIQTVRDAVEFIQENL